MNSDNKAVFSSLIEQAKHLRCFIENSADTPTHNKIVTIRALTNTKEWKEFCKTLDNL